MYQLAIYYGRLVKCRSCGHLARGPNYCEQCGALLVTRHLLVLVAAVYALALAALLAVLIASAIATPPNGTTVCMADGHNCDKIEMRR